MPTSRCFPVEYWASEPGLPGEMLSSGNSEALPGTLCLEERPQVVPHYKRLTSSSTVTGWRNFYLEEACIVVYLRLLQVHPQQSLVRSHRPHRSRGTFPLSSPLGLDVLDEYRWVECGHNLPVGAPGPVGVGSPSGVETPGASPADDDPGPMGRKHLIRRRLRGPSQGEDENGRRSSTMIHRHRRHAARLMARDASEETAEV